MNTALLQSKAAALAGTTPGKNACLRQRSAKYSRPISRRSLKAWASAKFEAQVCAVLGSQWGDEGKGKLVDILAKQYDIVARAQGGANAGHTIYDDEGQRYALHLIPSGILSESCVCVIGNGVVLHLPGLLEEMDGLAARGVKFDSRLLISDRAHLLFDLHKEVDGLREAELAGSKIGTTKRGIGPAYSSKAIRNGLRVSDLKHEAVFQHKLTLLTEDSRKRFGENLVYDEKAEFAKYREMYKRILPFVTDTISYVHEAYEAGKRILVEGANATMLDIDFGTYPYVTSSNPSVGGIATGLGLPPNKYEALVGVVKAYTTRVGGGPYPTELHGDFAEALRAKGHEYGTTTGRPRRVGWLDVVALRYASRVNGFTHLNLTKLDVLDDLSELSIGIAYNSPNGTRHTASIPADVETLEKCTVEYETHPGWQKDISGCRKWEDLPENARKYVLRVEELVGVPIRWIGVGPGRDAIVEKV